jgi:hypothetical protein
MGDQKMFMSGARSIMMPWLCVAVALSVQSCRWNLPPNDKGGAVDFTVRTIDTRAPVGAFDGPAFIAVGELAGDRHSQEFLLTEFAFDDFGLPLGGTVLLYEVTGSAWSSTTVVSAEENVRNPNRPTIADVDGDGLNDFILPAGGFLNAVVNDATGSITWWRNNGDGTFERNTIVDAVGGAYEGVVFVDFDRDGIKDIISTFQDSGDFFFGGTSIPVTVLTHFFKGVAPGMFADPVTLCECGGPLPVVFDVNGDRRYDIVTAQYLGVATEPDPDRGLSDESFIWLENTARKGQPLSKSTFRKHVIARGLGESVQILPVDNIDGNLIYGAIGINQVNQAVNGGVEPLAVRLRPGRNIRREWKVEVLKDDFDVKRTNFGATAPGPAAEGDVDGDGDVDLVVPGGADERIYWLERRGDGSWFSRDIGVEFGDAERDWGLGGLAIADLDWDGRNEIIFSAYNELTVHIAERVEGTGGNLPAFPRIPDRRLPY